MSNMIKQFDKNWQYYLKHAVSDPVELCKICDIPTHSIYDDKAFVLRVPLPYIARIKKGDKNDPLLKQILPDKKETLAQADFLCDPLNEQQANKLTGLIHKYASRVLLTLTGACAVHCRYCFRRHFPYEANRMSGEAWLAILRYIKENKSINEVILSGGDPMMVSDESLITKIKALFALPQIKRVRLHTRLPIVIPSRITDKLIDYFGQLKHKIIVVVHCNHPQEIDEDTAAALQKLSAAGIILLNQSVLLNKINDNAQTLINLSEKLYDCGVSPYYLHILDKVAGSTHFAVETASIKKIYQQLLAGLPGFLVPKLVQEVPGLAYKKPILT